MSDYDLSEIIGSSRPTSKRVVEYLSKQLMIRFTLELDYGKLGYGTQRLVMVRFLKKPSVKRLREQAKVYRCVNFMCRCDGDFDILLQTVNKSFDEYKKWEGAFLHDFIDYGIEISSSDFLALRFGYLPACRDVIDDSEIDAIDRKLIAELNENSRKSFVKLEEAIGVRKETLRHRTIRLEKNGIIKRFTIAVQRPEREYLLAYATDYVLDKKTSAKVALARAKYANYDSGNTLLNTFQFVTLLTGSRRFFSIGIFDNGKDAKKAVDAHIKVFGKDKVKLYKAEIKNLIKGFYPFRRLNMKRSYV